MQVLSNSTGQIELFIAPDELKFDVEEFNRKVITELSAFLNTELSAFYFDIRKDTLYCDPQSSLARRASLTCIEFISFQR